ncbi:hypothetical protein EAI28_15045 [Faecalicatena contorta]|uniref:hypothetical protein n=1 Tax=Faecalicatena contorta TaxID=39482 RepID=UPI00129D6891|nr:hypothetical protein [Faecalicatena contorta]MRM89649.1 hypothetical protein [Faecalicatena contorta]GKH33497.1 hypothetical protein CE91St64_29040 [Faecalicatena contorta]
MQQQFNKEEVKRAVLDYISENKQVSYKELEWFFNDKQIPFKGEFDILSEKCDHIVFWTGWNEEIHEVLGELIDEEYIHREPTAIFTYITDGGVLKMPLVKQNRDYKTDHWLPTVFCIGPE